MPKTKMGRPPLPKKERRSATLTVRLKPEERRSADRAAEKAGLSVTEWARRAVVEKALSGPGED
jgi:predicted HicB family RNase H-like nuclease